MHVFFFCLQGSNSFPIFHIQLLFIGFCLFVARCYSLKVSLALSLSLIIVRLITITIIFHIFLFRVPLNRTAGRDLHARQCLRPWIAMRNLPCKWKYPTQVYPDPAFEPNIKSWSLLRIFGCQFIWCLIKSPAEMMGSNYWYLIACG